MEGEEADCLEIGLCAVEAVLPKPKRLPKPKVTLQNSFGPLGENDNANGIPDTAEDNENGIPTDYWLFEDPAGTTDATLVGNLV